jgi:hypothetical protein
MATTEDELHYRTIERLRNLLRSDMGYIRGFEDYLEPIATTRNYGITTTFKRRTPNVKPIKMPKLTKLTKEQMQKWKQIKRRRRRRRILALYKYLK